MNKHIDYQIIKKNGHPLFAVLAYEDLMSLLRSAKKSEDDDVIIPDAVVRMVVIEEMHPIKAWRKHFGLSQHELAKKMNVKQPAVAKLETTDISSLRKETLTKIAKALHIQITQLTI